MYVKTLYPIPALYMYMYLLLSQSTCDEVVPHHIHVTHASHVSREGSHSVQGEGVRHKHVTSHITTADAMFGRFQQAYATVSQCLSTQKSCDKHVSAIKLPLLYFLVDASQPST